MRAGLAPNQSIITDFFDLSSVVHVIENNVTIRTEINNSIGREPEKSVAPILEELYSTAEQNSKKSKKNANRFSKTVKEFASSLYCLIGKSSYDFVQTNLGSALPSTPTVTRSIAKKPKLKEGEFDFVSVKEHLETWKAPYFVHVHIDDTRVLCRVEYDSVTERFVGFCLPLCNGLPLGDAFVVDSFEGIQDIFKTTKIASYAHCMVARPVICAPSFTFFVNGTDGTDNNDVVFARFEHVPTEFTKLGIKVLSFVADGASAFLKAMIRSSKLFQKCTASNVPNDWTFYFMPSLLKSGLSAQDFVHVMAKLRTRLLLPSNILVMGKHSAVVTHLKFVLNEFPKERHGLSLRTLDVRDKQNYSSIEVMLNDGVFECLEEINAKIDVKGTIAYLKLMKDIRDAFLNKELSPSQRIILSWRSVFFLRIWRIWLQNEGYDEKDHFVTANVYLCVELNCHLINLVHNVKNGIFPVESLRLWLLGCEELYRILRAMTSMFSTILNFTVKGILQRIHKLNHLSNLRMISLSQG